LLSVSTMPTTRLELELESNPRFLTLERTVQRIGIGLMALFVVAGALGVFGDGVVSTATARAGSLTVTYERVTRQTVRSTMTIEAASPDVARIGFDRAFLDEMTIHETRPRELEMRSEADRVVFLVPAINGLATLRLHIEPLGPGVHRTRVTTQDGGRVELRQIVLF
jgi:hypothetical protein